MGSLGKTQGRWALKIILIDEREEGNAMGMPGIAGCGMKSPEVGEVAAGKWR